MMQGTGQLHGKHQVLEVGVRAIEIRVLCDVGANHAQPQLHELAVVEDQAYNYVAALCEQP